MGLIKRLARLTGARIEAFLNAVEDPETLFPQLIREMEGKVGEAQKAEAKALSAVKSAQRKLDELVGQIRRRERGAELALAKGDEETARDALAAQLGVEKDIDQREAALSLAESALAQARDARTQIQEELEKLRARKEEILARARAARMRKKVQQTISWPAGSGKSILDEVTRMEAKVLETEAGVQIQREMDTGTGSPSLDERLSKLEKEAEVEKRLAALRKKKK